MRTTSPGSVRLVGNRLPPRLTPGTRLILIAVPIVLLLGAIGLIFAWRNYESQRERITDESALLSASAGADTDRFLRGQIALLEAVAASPTVRGTSQAAIEVYLHELMAVRSEILGVSWIDRDGYIRATATPAEAGDAVFVGDRDYFSAVTQAEAPFVSAASEGQVAGRPAVTIAVPTRDTGGALTGMISARIGLTELEQAITAFRPRGVGEVLIVDRVGQLIVHSGQPAEIQDISASQVVQRAREMGSGVLTDVDGPRGTSGQLLSFASVPTGDWMVFVSRNADEAFAPARTTFAAEAVTLAGVVLAGIAGLIWTGRWLNQAAAERERLLTAEHEARTEAEAAVQLRDQVLAGVSHDLKNPLTTIRGLAQLLRRQVDRLSEPAPALLDGLDRIEGSTAKMSAMMDELLDAARLQMGQPLELRRSPVDLAALVDSTADAYRRTADLHQINVHSSEAPLMGEWDGARLERVLDNLLSNAIKYSPGGGAVTLTLAAERTNDGGWAELTVRDEGIGIPDEDLPHIFDRFYRARNVTGRIAGTGIGLAGAFRIVEQHGGTLTAAPAPVRGTIFTMRLPIVPLDEVGMTIIDQPASPDSSSDMMVNSPPVHGDSAGYA
jgi:signal transduction histidine kinase